MYALNPVLNLLPITAIYFRLRHTGETWSLFALFIGMIGAFFWMVFGFQQLEQFRYLARFSCEPTDSASAIRLASDSLESAERRSGWIHFGLVPVDRVVAAQDGCEQTFSARILYRFRRFAGGFSGSGRRVSASTVYTAGIAGAIGGPLFWILAGLDLLKHSASTTAVQGSPTMVAEIIRGEKMNTTINTIPNASLNAREYPSGLRYLFLLGGLGALVVGLPAFLLPILWSM